MDPPLTCPFCNPPAEDEIILANDLCYARYDKYPVSPPGHLLLIPPYRHIPPDFFAATDAEHAALLALVREAKTLLDEQFHPDGYNIGVNVRAAAGQTVMHLHVHVIPPLRWRRGRPPGGRGGQGGAVPEKRVY
ncbi:HIT domain-containing protein [Methanoculleus chikugoensis]|uniref:HIT family protein n=1 Tax=Methanoculleus chikugoensis TaxID=118126 RepID=UPI0006D0AC73|nr:HIT family protein [Methanoculleus chikugoensis]